MNVIESVQKNALHGSDVVDLSARTGFVRLARQAAAPIVPVARVGSQRQRCSSDASSGWPGC